MSKKTISLTLMTLLLAALTLSTATAQSEVEEVRISPWLSGQEYVVGPGQVGVIRAGWAACTRGLVRVFINASNFELTLNGEPLLTPEQVDQLWGPIAPCETCPGPCRGKQEPVSASWRYVLDLPPGEYELHSTIWIDHPLIDGGDYDGDGAPDVFRPEDLYYDTLNTIVVLGE